jgi:hypothetical protein
MLCLAFYININKLTNKTSIKIPQKTTIIPIVGEDSPCSSGDATKTQQETFSQEA